MEGKEHAKASKYSFWLLLAYIFLGVLPLSLFFNLGLIEPYLLLFAPILTSIFSMIAFVLAIIGFFQKNKKKLYSYLTLIVLGFVWIVLPFVVAMYLPGMQSWTPQSVYKEVVNMPAPKSISNLKTSSEPVGFLTDLTMTYDAEYQYFDELLAHKKYGVRSEWNEPFREVECHSKLVEQKCLKGVIFPYIHNLTYHSKSKKVSHSVVGMRD